jgi:hypothetical protein
MHATAGLEGRTRHSGRSARRLPLRRIVIVGLLLLALVEPLLMYRSLMRQREQRRQASESSLEVSASARANR